MRRVRVQLPTSISAMSLALLHATNTRRPSAEGWAQVGEHATSPGLVGSMPWLMLWPACWSTGDGAAAEPEAGVVDAAAVATAPAEAVAGAAAAKGAPVKPFSCPFFRTKYRD